MLREWRWHTGVEVLEKQYEIVGLLIIFDRQGLWLYRSSATKSPHICMRSIVSKQSEWDREI